MVNVLDKGILELRDKMGDDLAVVSAARVSNGITRDASKGVESDQKLINFLMKHRHGTPFEHSVYTFYVKCPIFVAREWFRHRIGAFNEISGRYVEFEPEFYLPTEFRVPAKTNKQGSFFPIAETGAEKVKLDEWNENLHEFLTIFTMNAYDAYKGFLEVGMAKEMARMILPLNLYTEFFWTVNARSLMNFLSLRTAPDAQYEIRQYALEIEELFGITMPLTYRAWVKNDRLAP